MDRWIVDPDGRLIVEELTDNVICDCYEPEFAAQIVREHNSGERLREAAQAAVDVLGGKAFYDDEVSVMDALRAALQEAVAK